jgi:hypothetical protein
MLKNQHSFSIQNTLDPETQEPFGEKYAGQFTVRRPSAHDKKMIALKDAASMAVYGTVDIRLIGEGTKLLSYIDAFVKHVALGDIPKWFGMDQMFDETDENAALAVWEEVQAFLATFRPGKAPGAGGGAEGEPEPLVPEKVQPAP